MCMAGLENDAEFRDNLDSYDEDMDIEYVSLSRYQLIRDAYPLFSAICHELAQSFVADEKNCKIGLAGYWEDNPFNICKPYEAWFPQEAYLAWWNLKPRGMPLPQWFSELPDKETVDNCDCEKSKQTIQAPDDQMIVEGLTVANVRAMLDKNNPRYRKELHAAVMVWASFESKPEFKGLTAKDAVKRRLNDWTEKEDTTLQKSEYDRIAVMVNWDKDGNKQLPKNDKSR